MLVKNDDFVGLANYVGDGLAIERKQGAKIDDLDGPIIRIAAQDSPVPFSPPVSDFTNTTVARMISVGSRSMPNCNVCGVSKIGCGNSSPRS